MARRIKDAFAGGKAFIAFITAGDPNLAATEEYILEMERAGADLIEIGIPFSDPIAEGVVIQEADLRALRSGTTTDKIFDMVGRLRQKTDMPLVFMGYLNPVFHYGYERFFARCEECGISGIIIPDLPYEEKGECEAIAAAHGVDVISMIAVPNSGDRFGGAGLPVCGFFNGRHRRPLRDQNRPRLNSGSNPQGYGHSCSCRLRNQHTGTGGKNRLDQRRSNCWQRDRADRGPVWDRGRTAHL